MKKIAELLGGAILTVVLAIKCTLSSVQDTISAETTAAETNRPLHVHVTASGIQKPGSK
ncbi:hypothetical protein L3C95_14515 [Chitinophaga filiformis]|uniref:hypothetical protein n=1 Tax=Chitinophaga filiformis TaxID=104663 RepID=UPI001F399F49|nr:hypothetical protein [Chitinophaga filiformis]MCF6404104.1 hypothetical protein [Chitinophaga filiformis]